jgi:hypothetical protein
MPIDYDIVDLISDLLQGEQAGAFHFMTEADPYINRAGAEIRRPLLETIKSTIRREGELAAILDELGSTPPPPAVSKENQYLAFLSVDFLLPKLKEAKLASIRNYEKAIRIADGDETATPTLQQHLREHRNELEQIDKALSHVKGLPPLSTTRL